MRYATYNELAAAAADVRAEWMRRAACAGLSVLMDPPVRWRTETVVENARHVCWSCPVLDDCRAWVLDLTSGLDPGGVCAAMTEEEREHHRRTGGAPIKYRWCKTCRRVRRETDFRQDPRGGKGRVGHCRVCDQRRAAEAATA